MNLTSKKAQLLQIKH